MNGVGIREVVSRGNGSLGGEFWSGCRSLVAGSLLLSA